MADESILDRTGPVFIVAALAVVLVVIVFVVIRGNANWGEPSPEEVVAPTSVGGEGEAPH